VWGKKLTRERTEVLGEILPQKELRRRQIFLEEIAGSQVKDPPVCQTS
jgi:hypothetical protein